MQLLKDWVTQEQAASEEDLIHREPYEEYRFYTAVTEGNVDAVRENCKQHRFLDNSGVGRLSRDPVQNMKYHFVIGIGLISRLCAERGMEREKSMRLSDFYIQRLDDLSTIEEVEALHDRMAMDYVRRMKVLRNNAALSRPISECLNYIYSHVTKRITIDDLAEYTGNSASYISRLFKEELGVPASNYIRSEKVKAAKNMLRFSDYSLVEISNYLDFSSQSHFIQTFEKETGYTPKKYRENYHATLWKGDDITGMFRPDSLNEQAG